MYRSAFFALIGLALLSALACNLGQPAATTPAPSPTTESLPAATDTPLPLPTAEPMPTEPAGPLDCGDDYACMIGAAESCRPAQATVTTTIDMFGMLITTNSSYQILGLESDQCVFYLRTGQQTIAFGDEFVQQLRDNGVTDEQIQQQLEEANRQAATVEGLDGTCRFHNSADLAALLGRWRDGQFSTEDWSTADCEGEMFDQ